ncbi:hypothetical protein [Actinocorallia longicatena]|uniref:DNA polymerase III beta subunit-like protein n=1 Tax=Actinocorallia longicatena TaxID=111803 RepID=A0ABP6QAB8_9ACTN
MTTTTATAVTVALTGRSLRNLLVPVLTHTGTDDPYDLDTVRVETNGRTLYLSATDRYTLAVVRHRLHGRQPALAPIRLDAAPLALACGFLDDNDRILLKVTPEGARLTSTPGFGPEHNIIKGDIDARRCYLPDWRKILLAPLNEPPTAPLLRAAYRPEHLARFRTMPADEPIVFRPTTPNLTLVTCGTRFLGGIAPTKTDNTRAAATLTTWIREGEL